MCLSRHHILYLSSVVILIGTCSSLIVCAGAVCAAFSINLSIWSLVIPPPAPPFAFFPAWTPKVAKTPVKTLAMKVGSSFCSGIPSAGGSLMYANVRIPPLHTRIPSLTKVDRIASCSSLSSAASFNFAKGPFFLVSLP